MLVATAVIEGIRRDVEDAHDDGSVEGEEFAFAI